MSFNSVRSVIAESLFSSEKIDVFLIIMCTMKIQQELINTQKMQKSM